MFLLEPELLACRNVLIATLKLVIVLTPCLVYQSLSVKIKSVPVNEKVIVIIMIQLENPSISNRCNHYNTC